MIVNLDGMAEKVASLTTIGAPHWGSEVADVIDTLAGAFLRDSLGKFFSIDGLRDLRTDVCQQFNAEAEKSEADNDVIYRVYHSKEDLHNVFLPLQAGWLTINHQTGQPNDGMVSIASQMWQPMLTRSDGSSKIITQIRFPVSADHLNEVGWWTPSRFHLSITQSIVHQARVYEDQIKHVYLDIARNLPWEKC